MLLLNVIVLLLLLGVGAGAAITGFCSRLSGVCDFGERASGFPSPEVSIALSFSREKRIFCRLFCEKGREHENSCGTVT